MPGDPRTPGQTVSQLLVIFNIVLLKDTASFYPPGSKAFDNSTFVSIDL